MRIGASAAMVWAAVCLHAVNAGAQRPLTLADVLARAREQAPEVVSARLALEETRGRLLGASLRLQSNPELDLGLGNRQGVGSRFTDFELGIGQNFEPASRRSSRIAGARAAIAQSAAVVDETARGVLRSASIAYYRGLHADLRIRLLDAGQQLAVRIHAAAERRFKAGDIAVLDVNIARASLGRVRAEREAAEAVRVLALGELQQLLGLDEAIAVHGDLVRPADADLNAAVEAALQRPELRALEAAIREAEADIRIGSTYGKPDYGLGVRYAREEDDHIVLGALTLTLPLFSKGQEQRSVGAARATRLRSDLDAARARVRLEVRSTFEVYRRRQAAVRLLETDAIAGLDENETLTTRSFEVGQLGLPELLLIRREILDTRSQYLDALLEAALARVDLDASAALLR
jgi:cobalt-zinc-cadmium efflux system outer membrane protein